MALEGKTLKLCDCNGTLPLDARKLAATLKSREPVKIHRELCRKEAGAFQAALADPDVVVACTQEAPLFGELASDARSKSSLAFANIREFAGWSREGAAATPKIAALLAAAALPEPEPVPAVEFKSGGELLIVGPSAVALDWAQRLHGDLQVSVLITSAQGGELPASRGYPVWSGTAVRVKGWLGAFEVEWQPGNPIDLELCTRCNACVRACPESAIDFTYQIDLARCKAHRACVKACGAIGAIDFSRAPVPRAERFDLVLDLQREPAIRNHALALGYLAPGADPLEQALAAQRLAALVGDFEKPRFVQYDARICAHSRSGVTGCTRCLDVCSAKAIAADGDGVRVEPHLCAGCGGCSTVCPSGALRYAYPSVSDAGSRLKTLLATYREAGGRDAQLLFHDAEAGRAALLALGRRGPGLPARAIPFEYHHVAAIGLDLLLGAICYGAARVSVLVTDSVAAEYAQALGEQARLANLILEALGYSGVRCELIEASALETDLWKAVESATPPAYALFNLAPEKRATLDFAIDHLARNAPAPQPQIELPRGAPFGAIAVDRGKCTMCKSCIGACPEGALLDAPETPVLRFIERNCVQCGLCEKTCPEAAIALTPRLLLTAQAREAVTLNEAEPFPCVRCGKAFATKPMVETMLAKIGGHAMFAGAAAQRLQMCGDCRIADMMETKGEATIFDFTGRK